MDFKTVKGHHQSYSKPEHSYVETIGIKTIKTNTGLNDYNSLRRAKPLNGKHFPLELQINNNKQASEVAKKSSLIYTFELPVNP